MCIKTHLYQVRLCYDSPRLFDHFIDIVIPYLFTNIFDTPPQKVRKVFSCPVKVHEFSVLKSEFWEWNSMSKTLYNENKIWQIQIVALVDLRTVPEVPGPLGEHSKGKTTIYFLTCALCAALQPIGFSTLSPKIPTPFSKHFVENHQKQQSNKRFKKKRKRWKSQKCFEEYWKSNPNPKKGPPPRLLWMRNLAFNMFGASPGMKQDFLFHFFSSDFGNLVRRNVQNIVFWSILMIKVTYIAPIGLRFCMR